jgi:hypothetical protein
LGNKFTLGPAAQATLGIITIGIALICLGCPATNPKTLNPCCSTPDQTSQEEKELNFQRFAIIIFGQIDRDLQGSNLSRHRLRSLKIFLELFVVAAERRMKNKRQRLALKRKLEEAAGQQQQQLRFKFEIFSSLTFI